MPMYKKIISIVIAFFTIFSLTFNVYAVSDCDVIAKSIKKIDENLYNSQFIDCSAKIDTLGKSTITVNNDEIDNNKKLVVTEIAKDDDAYSWINNIMAGTDFVCYDIQIYDSENTQCFVDSDLNFLFMNPLLNNKNIELYFINVDGIKEKITTSVKDGVISFSNNNQGIYAIGYSDRITIDYDEKPTQTSKKTDATLPSTIQNTTETQNNTHITSVDSGEAPVNSGQDFHTSVFLVLALSSVIVFFAFRKRKIS